jgi:hypothetical protein
MLRKKGDKIYAVLNDFDLAVHADVKSMSSKHRTGTKPFMAIDLIHPLPSAISITAINPSALLGLLVVTFTTREPRSCSDQRREGIKAFE